MEGDQPVDTNEPVDAVCTERSKDARDQTPFQGDNIPEWLSPCIAGYVIDWGLIVHPLGCGECPRD